MATLLLVRHAKAAADELRLPGADLPLTPDGEREARLLANRLADFDPERIISSDARRAVQTAEIVARELDVPVDLTPSLREMDFGDWAGRTYADIVTADPAAHDWFIRPVIAPPNGEPAADVARRVLETLRAIAEQRVGYVVVVGHSGALCLAAAEGLGMPRASWWRLRLTCASISTVTWAADGLILESWNDTAHLDVVDE